MTERLVDLVAASVGTGIPIGTIRRWISAGKLESVKRGKHRYVRASQVRIVKQVGRLKQVQARRRRQMR